MRKTSLIFLGSLVGVVATVLLTQPHTLLMDSAAVAAASDTYLELNLFGDVFQRVRAAYVEKQDDRMPAESAIHGLFAGHDRRSGYRHAQRFRDRAGRTR